MLLESILKYFVGAMVLAVPLYPKFPFIKIPGTFVSVRLEDVLIAFTFIIWITYVFPKLKSILSGKIIRSIFLFLSAGFVSLFAAIFITETVIPHIGVLHWLRRVEYFLPLLFGYTVIKMRRDNIYFYLNLFLIIVVVSFIYGYGQKNFNWPIIITQNLEYSKGVALRWTPGSHINANFAGHYDLATFLVLIMPLLITAFFILKGVRYRIILLISMISGLWLLVNTASRISLVSYLMASMIALFIVRKYKQMLLVLFVSLIFISFSSNLQDRYQRLFDVIEIKMGGIGENLLVGTANAQESLPINKRQKATPTPTLIPVVEDRSTSIRFNVEWPRAVRAFSKNPLFGTGYSSITLATDNHYLRLLGEVGLFGFLAFFLIFLRVVMELIKALPLDSSTTEIKRIVVAGLVGAIPGLLLNAVFIDIFEASKFAILFWFVIGMALALVSKDSEYEI